MDSSYSDISMEDFSEVMKGFIDMLILASGYQSTGHPAYWDSHNIKKAFQWAILIESVLGCWKSSNDRRNLVAEVDAALSEIISCPSFPQGLKHLSSASLCQARKLVIRHLVHTMPLRDAHMRATIAAIVEVDVQELRGISSDALEMYLDRLMYDVPGECVGRGMEISVGENSLEGGLTVCALREIRRRELEVSCLSTAEIGLDALSGIMRNSFSSEVGSTLSGEKSQSMTSFMAEEKPVDPEIWSKWKSRSLSYLLDKRTVRMVSGAKLLLSAPKHQWMEVIRRMDVSVGTNDYYEQIELLLLGSIGSKWTSIIETVISSSYKCVTFSDLYREVQDFLYRRWQNISSELNMSDEEKGALEYLEDILSKRVDCLWKLLSVLPAMAIPLRSSLSRLYLTELESKMRGGSSAIRCCSCIMEGKSHTDCELAERIWCLYIFHARGSWIMKLRSILRLKKVQYLRLERKSMALGSADGRVVLVDFRCCFVGKQLFRRLRAQWKPLLSWQRSSGGCTSGYNYDAQSYSQNFDDGCCDDHRSPLAPSPR